MDGCPRENLPGDVNRIAARASVMGVMTDELPLSASVRPATRDDLVADLFRTEYRSLVGLARLLVDGDAEEVVQESFTRLYASFRQLGDSDKALAYLRTTVLNQARSRLRRRRTARTRAHLVPADNPADPFADRLVDADAERVRLAVRRLPRRQQQCIVLRHYSGCTEREIADTLGISGGSVKQHLDRATTALSTRLEEFT